MMQTSMVGITFEDFYWATAVYFWMGFLILIVCVPIIFIWFWKRMLPKASRTFFWIHRRKTPPLLLCHDSGKGMLVGIKERAGEGVVMTDRGRYKILPRYLSASPAKPKGEEEAGPALNPNPLDEMTVKDYSDWVVKRTYLEGLGLPFFVGYTGSLCLLNPEALALYEAGNLAFQNEEGKFMFNPRKVKGKTVDKALQPLLLLDPRKIKQIVPAGYDHEQIAALVADAEELARLGKGIPRAALMGILVILIIVAVVGLLFFAPQFLQGLVAH